MKITEFSKLKRGKSMAIERLVPGTTEWQAYFANHIFRYRFALAQLQKFNKKKTLDAACGVGYGSKYLAEYGIHPIVAIDKNKEALIIARAQFSHPQINYLEDDCHELEHAREFGRFEGVISFETIEHLARPQAFLRQCHSILEDQGVMILSTPNSIVSSPGGKTTWEFHEKEYEPEELKVLLKDEGFSNFKLYGQAYSPTGLFRQQVRLELNKSNSNPFMRLGRTVQRIFKGHRFGATLPEQLEDFEVIPESSFASNPPFVLLAVAVK